MFFSPDFIPLGIINAPSRTNVRGINSIRLHDLPLYRRYIFIKFHPSSADSPIPSAAISERAFAPTLLLLLLLLLLHRRVPPQQIFSTPFPLSHSPYLIFPNTAPCYRHSFLLARNFSSRPRCLIISGCFLNLPRPRPLIRLWISPTSPIILVRQSPVRSFPRSIVPREMEEPIAIVGSLEDTITDYN